MYKVVGPDQVVIKVCGDLGQRLFKMIVHVDAECLILQAGEDGICFGLQEIPAVVAALQRGKDILDKGLDPVIEVE